jgi:hypothetical protein
MFPTRIRPSRMTCTSLAYALLGISLLAASGCSSKDKTDPVVDGGGLPDSSTDAGPADAGGASVSCYTELQFNCEERPSPTAEQADALEVICSSSSGAFRTPADCPTPKFVGKCTFTTDGTLRVRRYYTGADAAYEQDFCVNTAKGVWSTTF